MKKKLIFKSLIVTMLGLMMMVSMVGCKTCIDDDNNGDEVVIDDGGGDDGGGDPIVDVDDGYGVVEEKYRGYYESNAGRDSFLLTDKRWIWYQGTTNIIIESYRVWTVDDKIYVLDLGNEVYQAHGFTNENTYQQRYEEGYNIYIFTWTKVRDQL